MQEPTSPAKLHEDTHIGNGGDALVKRQLKYWAVLGMDPTCRTKEDHKEKWWTMLRAWDEGTLPETSELDRQAPTWES